MYYDYFHFSFSVTIAFVVSTIARYLEQCYNNVEVYRCSRKRRQYCFSIVAKFFSHNS